jgi:hypothetical protein
MSHSDQARNLRPPELVRGYRILRQWLRVSPALVLFVLLAASAVAAGALSLNRLCFGEMQFLSEPAAMDAWVDRLIAQRRHTLQIRHDGSIEFRPVEVIPYRDRADFHERNPNCCNTGPYSGDRPPPSTIDVLLGKWAYVASATYVVRYRERNGETGSTTVTATAPVTNCGQPWRGY